MSNYLDRLYISGTARYDELSAIRRLYNYVFTDDDVVCLGDSAENYCPDVYTKDLEKGIEIVTCENSDFYQNNTKYFSSLNRNKNLKPLFEDRELLKLSEISLNKNFIFKKPNFVFFNRNFENEEKEFYERLRTVTNNKLKNLNLGKYDACKKISLAIFSGFVQKPYVEDKKVFEIISEENSKFLTKFDNIYFICNDKILKISAHNEMYEITDDNIKSVFVKEGDEKMNMNLIKKLKINRESKDLINFNSGKEI